MNKSPLTCAMFGELRQFMLLVAMSQIAKDVSCKTNFRSSYFSAVYGDGVSSTHSAVSRLDVSSMTACLAACRNLTDCEGFNIKNRTRSFKTCELFNRTTYDNETEPFEDSTFFQVEGYYKGEDCYDLLVAGVTESGVYMARSRRSGEVVKLVCDMKTAGGGWTVLMRRQNGLTDFMRNWTDYKTGFGNYEDGDFWIGNERMHQLTTNVGKSYRLRVDMTDYFQVEAFAEYASFVVEDETNKYRLHLGTYTTGTPAAGDSLTYHSGMMFTTWDNENDIHVTVNCGEKHKNGWWYRYCVRAQLTGLYGEHAQAYHGILWEAWHGWEQFMKYVDLKIKPI